MQDSTRLDAVIMASLLTHAKSAGSESLELLSRAFSEGAVPERGMMTKNTVQAAYSVLSARMAKALDAVENPLPAPHNLSWYFRSCACPQDVRHFATRLSKHDVRVWSVAQASAGEWKVLVQVEGAESKNEAVSSVAGSSLRPSKALRNRIVSSVNAVTSPKGDVPSAFPRLRPVAGNDGIFVELTISE